MAHALVRAVSRLFSTPFLQWLAGVDVGVDAARVGACANSPLDDND
jgi:hypothetical protein